MERYSEPPPLVARLSHIDGQPTIELYDGLWLSCLDRLPMARDDEARAWAHQAIEDRRVVLVWDVLDPAEQKVTEEAWRRWLARAEPGHESQIPERQNIRKRGRSGIRGLPAKKRIG